MGVVEAKGLPAVAEPEWISIAAAARLIGVNRHTLTRMVYASGLLVRCIPGTRPRVRRDEVLALAKASVRRAGFMAVADGPSSSD